MNDGPSRRVPEHLTHDGPFHTRDRAPRRAALQHQRSWSPGSRHIGDVIRNAKQFASPVERQRDGVSLVAPPASMRRPPNQKQVVGPCAHPANVQAMECVARLESLDWQNQRRDYPDTLLRARRLWARRPNRCAAVESLRQDLCNSDRSGSVDARSRSPVAPTSSCVESRRFGRRISSALASLALLRD
jgi:hypothetical protein